MHTYDDDRWAFEKWIVNVENIVVHIYRPDRSTGINITKKHTKKKTTKRKRKRRRESEKKKQRVFTTYAYTISSRCYTLITFTYVKRVWTTWFFFFTYSLSKNSFYTKRNIFFCLKKRKNNWIFAFTEKFSLPSIV